MNHAARLERLRSAVKTPLLVSRLPNLRYLTGFTGSNGFLLVRPDGPATFITDGRYGELAEPLVDALPATTLEVYTGSLKEALAAAATGLPTLGLEADGVTWQFMRDLADTSSTELRPMSGTVEGLRRVKDAAEVEALSAAAAAGDAAFAKLPELLDTAESEADLAWGLIETMRAHGAQVANWDPIVAAGAGASIPHYRSGRAPLGDRLLLLDYGCTVDGYHSDMSRTIWINGNPDDRMRIVHDVVAEAQSAGIDAVRPGVTCGEVDSVVRDVLRTHGLEKEFLHSTGHGVGLEIHEPPWVRAAGEMVLQPGDVVTVEPGVYLPGEGGVRIEDMVLVTEGEPRVLTGAPRDMVPA